MNRFGAGITACLATIACAGSLGGCGTSHHTSETTSSTGAPRAGEYRFAGAAVRIAFPGSPGMEKDPAPLVAVMPKHTSVTAWVIGDVGALENYSYELVMAKFPTGSTTATIDTFLSSYAKAPNTTMFGTPALHEINTIPFSTGTRYSGITAFNVGQVLVMAVGLDSVRAEVVEFLESLQVVSPPG
jgi:hypothetical protein